MTPENLIQDINQTNFLFIPSLLAALKKPNKTVKGTDYYGSYNSNSNPKTQVTDGIDITSWIAGKDQSTSITYSCWDFAGQSVYYNTHQVESLCYVILLY